MLLASYPTYTYFCCTISFTKFFNSLLNVYAKYYTLKDLEWNTLISEPWKSGVLSENGGLSKTIELFKVSVNLFANKRFYS